MNKLFYPTVIILVVLMQSCAGMQQDINVRNISINEVLQTVETNQDSVKSLKGMASVRIESIAENSAFSQATVVKEPDIFRLEIIAAFGKTIGVLLSDGDKVYLRTSRDELVFEDAENFNLSYFYPGIPPEITSKVLTEILLGRVPFGLWHNTYDLEIDQDSRMLAITYSNSINTDTTVLLDPISKRVEKALINLYNDRVVDIDFMDFGFDGMEFFPKVIRISADKYMLKLSYVSSLDINPDLESDIFKP